MMTKRLGDIDLHLAHDGYNGYLSTEHWCSGGMPYTEASMWFDSITTVGQLNRIIADAYNEASGVEC